MTRGAYAGASRSTSVTAAAWAAPTSPGRSRRIGTIDAVEQLTRYLDRIRRDPAMAGCRGVLAAQAVKPQARVLAEARGLAWVEVDLAELRGQREPALTLFA